VMGGRERPAKAPVSRGLVKDASRYIEVVPFNDAEALERLFIERGKEIACIIMEPAMMNIGIVVPQAGYLQKVRELCTRHGVIFIFDEIKTGFTIAAGGATERFGVRPDMLTLAKTLGGGLPSGAIGGTEEAMSVVEDGTVYQVGTFNGNPLTMAAARAKRAGRTRARRRASWRPGTRRDRSHPARRPVRRAPGWAAP